MDTITEFLLESTVGAVESIPKYSTGERVEWQVF